MTDLAAESPLATALRTRRERQGAAPRTTKATRLRAAKKTTPAPATTTRTKSMTPGQAVSKALAGVAQLAAGYFPLHAQIVVHQAEPLGPIVDQLAAEDERFREFVEKIGGWFAKSSARADLLAWGAATGAALALASGVGRDNMILSLIAAPLVETAAVEAATKIAIAEAKAGGAIDMLGKPIIDPERVAFLTQALLSPPTPPEPPSEDEPA
jgi:hypothetical protein